MSSHVQHQASQEETSENLSLLSKAWFQKIYDLDHYIALEEETRRFLNQNVQKNFVLYAVDTDIVKCYTNSWQLALGSSNANDGTVSKSTPEKNAKAYGVVFPPDEENSTAASGLTFSIAQYIFFQLNQHWPVFQLPTHAKETNKVFSSIAHDAHLSKKKIEGNLSLLETWMDETKNYKSKKINDFFQKDIEGNDGESLAHEELSSLFNKIEAFIISRKNSPSQEMDRYLRLLGNGALLSLDAIENIQNSEQGEVPNALNVLSGGTLSLSELIFESDRKDYWLKELNTAHGISPSNSSSKEEKKKKNTKILTDAEALARLETLNKRLKNINGRLILITGAEAILKATQGDFQKQYIRHFHSFLSSLLVAVEGKEFSIAEKYGNISDFFGFRALAHAPKSQERKTYLNNETFTDLQNNWIKVRDTMVKASITKDDDQSESEWKIILDQITKLKNQSNSNSSSLKERLQEDLQNLAQNIKKQLVRDKIALTTNFATTGIEFLFSLTMSENRNAPDVCFESYKHANNLFNSLKSCSSLQKLNPNLHEQLELLKEDTLSQEVGVNDLGYLQFLVFSGFFASAGQWSIAAELAGYAVDIANTQPKTKSDSHISGREAYYIQASAIRLSARSLKDYDLANKLLESAQQALKEDRRGRPELGISSLRFDVEELAIKVSKLHHQSKINCEKPELNWIEAALNDAQELLNKSTEYAEATVKENNKFAVFKIHVNVLQIISLLLHFKPSESEPSETQHKIDYKATIKTSYDAITNFLNAKSTESSIRRTKLISAYELFAQCYLKSVEKPLEKDNKLIERVKKNIGTSTELPTTDYDNDRYQKLREQCLRLLGVSTNDSL